MGDPCWNEDPELAAEGAELMARKATNDNAPVRLPDGLCLTLDEWEARDIPPPDLLMGEVLSTTTRALMVADTGLGKTNFTMGLGLAMSLGRGFLHWLATRPARVLFIDGEMSRRLVKVRLADAKRRASGKPAHFFMLCKEDVDEMQPLNTLAGQAFIEAVIDRVGGVDFIIFDNIMCLIAGDMKEEQPWQETLPWVRKLTSRNIGQIWIHHTGHDAGRSYGTKTREWQMDTVMLLTKVERQDTDVSFSISFTKARERAPHNRADFDKVTVALVDDAWEVDRPAAIASTKPSPKEKMPSPAAQRYHDALLNAVIKHGVLQGNRRSVTLDQWEAECVKLGLLENGDDRPTKKRRSTYFNRYRAKLVEMSWATCDGDRAWSTRA
ncbi:AAA domain-containing protein [Azospirillum brasilense]|uniref:AAA domain-containing protein n=1 Tax=Azospirillum brasilense TaxID=192 RepID=A0A560AG07_AZOBR|nr:AAA family ATPase [Azospirillum brasilense]TWA59259.1 AAA domain-containing protein [Azospirillum brasilense]